MNSNFSDPQLYEAINSALDRYFRFHPAGTDSPLKDEIFLKLLSGERYREVEQKWTDLKQNSLAMFKAWLKRTIRSIDNGH